MKDLVRNLRKRVIRKARKKSLSDPVQNEARMSALSYKSSGGEVMRKKTKGYQAGGKMKAKGMARGGKMKSKGTARGGASMTLASIRSAAKLKGYKLVKA